MDSVQSDVDVYWMAGCTACLRMKEFVESTGQPYHAVNIGTDPDAIRRLDRLGAIVPCVVVGDRWARGTDLAAVAALMGADYVTPVLLPSIELRHHYHVVIDTLCRLVRQADGPALHHRRPERDRSLLNISYHAASVMRVFLQNYDPEGFEGEHYVLTFESPVPPDVTGAEHVVARAQDTLARFDRWWALDGCHDPLDRVIPTYMGHRTLHESLEREVWHTAQHVRQMAMFLEEVGIQPDHPLSEADLAGLTLPDRIFA